MSDSAALSPAFLSACAELRVHDPSVVPGRNGLAAPRRAAFARSKRAASRRFSTIESTEDYHTFQDEEAGALFYGAYGHIRKMLDYTFHAGTYNKTRQFLHHSIIEGT
jgi:hypothetical protein